MTKFWNKYAPYWHVCMAIIGGIITLLFWFKDVSGYEGRISKLELDSEMVKENISAMRQEIHDLWKDNGHKE